ncbi:HupE/UreJ family protein [Alteraurantiacibacter aquimixticola]|uniref:HupE/UreJ family protein n=1 Tax=Alteraurantiacibacter aquimixticola TaxID=2489173 RepID=UPI001FE27AC1|nr:HupE/UreJ family protein [Alteraurantiacibacter aquimixticola]
MTALRAFRLSPIGWALLTLAAVLVTVALAPFAAFAHDVAEGDKAFVQSIEGPAIFPFLYLGAKHMVTGYDHIAFLVGVVFFLRRLKDVVLYVSMFTIGHSITLMGGVLMGIGANAYIIDAIIGLSVIYKGVENIGGFAKIGLNIDTRLAVLVFGLFHGMGLATKVMDLEVSPNGLLTNLISFNVGVELGQVIVLAFVVTLFNSWRNRPSFAKYAKAANIALIAVGVALTAVQIQGYLSS